MAGLISALFLTCSLSGQRERGGMKEENEEKVGILKTILKRYFT
jgi:hypothetical protein